MITIKIAYYSRYKKALCIFVCSCLCFCLLSVSGCVNYHGIHHQQYLNTEKKFATQRSIPGAKQASWPTTQWAKQFSDPNLCSLIQEAVQHNPDLQVAVARQNQAKALVDARNAVLLPQIQFFATAARNKVVFPGVIPANNTWENFSLTALTFSYELDFWGKNYASLAQALSEEKVSQAMRYESELMISTLFATVYNQLDYQYHLREVLRRTVKQRKTLEKITQVQVNSGLATQVQVYQAQNLSASAQTQLVQTEGDIVNTRQQLGVLLGAGPDRGFTIEQPRMPSVATPHLPEQLPANLLGRRPDIVAARWQVEAALHGVQNIKARFYPNVNLYAIASEFSFGASRLFLKTNPLLAVSPALSLPLFDAGALRAQLKGQYAVLDEQIATYNATLNHALGEVAEQLSTIRAIDNQLTVQKNALFTAQKAYELSQKQYQIGLTSQLVVLDAETRYLAEQQLRLQLIKARRDAQIALIKALGGGFDEQQLPTIRTVASPDRLLKKDVHVSYPKSLT